MRRIIVLVPLLLAVSCQTITEPDILGDGDSEPVEQRFDVVGYHAWWAGEAWREYDFNTLDGIYFFALEVGEDGRLSERRGWPESWQSLIATARATGTKVIPSVTLLDPERYLSVFGDSVATRNLLEDLVDLATDVSADGVHLDFEIFQPVPFGVRQAVTDLVADLRVRVDSLRTESQLTMFTLAEDGPDVLDELALAEHLDQLIVQAYDLHWQTGDTAGPIAPIDGWDGRNWNGILARYTALGIERSQLSFTIPYFGYEWPTTDYLPGASTTGAATILAYGSGTPDLPSARERAILHGKLRDSSSGSPYYAYRDSVGWRQGWFEDAESIAEKYSFAVERGLGGVAIFPLSYGDYDLLTTLATVRADLLTSSAP